MIGFNIMNGPMFTFLGNIIPCPFSYGVGEFSLLIFVILVENPTVHLAKDAWDLKTKEAKL